ncbi:hypothetical protein PG994_003922 [Apiospora phragmitis]|uniref:Uncharacterized protein n=1 Tax=Apiospora phragmitis TaxID=2905665 RepID=A0ABR1VZH2_9PEZI
MMDFESTGVQGVAGRPQEPSSNDGTAPTEVSCTSASSDGSYSSNVSPPSSVRSPNGLGDTNPVNYANVNSFLSICPVNSTSNIEGPSTTNFSGHMYTQSAQVLLHVCDPDLAAVDVSPGDSFGGSAAANTERANVHSGRRTPPLSRLHIPYNTQAQEWWMHRWNRCLAWATPIPPPPHSQLQRSKALGTQWLLDRQRTLPPEEHHHPLLRRAAKAPADRTRTASASHHQ